MPTQIRRCPSCGDERAFEAPPCSDGHGPDCADLACLDCGTALIVDPPAAGPHPGSRPRRSALGAAA